MRKRSLYRNMVARMQKILFILFFICCEEIVAAETLFVAPDGNFMQNGKPVFLLGPVNMNRPYLQQGRYPFDREAPKEWQWLYNQDVSEEQIRRLGGKIWATSPERTFLHVFDPRFSGSVSNRQTALENFIDRYKGTKSYSKVRWIAYHSLGDEFYRVGFRNHEAMMHRMKMPLYVELGSLNWLWQQPDVFSDCIPGNAFNPTVGNSMFSLGFSLIQPKGREQYRKAYRYSAEIFRSYGSRVLCYELFNEAKYEERSPAMDQRFLAHLKDKFRTLEKVNHAWGSRYTSWEEILRNWSQGREIEKRFFIEGITTDFVKVLRDDIRKISPESGVTVQLHGNDDLRTLWHGFNFRRLAGVLDWINSGTGNSAYEHPIGKGEEEDILGNVNLPEPIRTSILSAKLCLAAAEGKPIVNNEVYVGRSYDTLLNTIWTEVIRGRNSSHIFAFNKRINFRMSMQEDADRYPYNLLNRIHFKPEGLRAMSDAAKEIDFLSPLILPRKNRTPAKIAVLHSYATVRAGGKWQFRHKQIYTAAMGLEFTHLGWMPIFEEDLREQLGRYKVLIAEGVSCVLPETEAILERFVRNGGILIAGLEPMDRDFYCRKRGSRLLNFTLAPYRGKVERHRLEGGILALPDQEIGRMDGWKTVMKGGDTPVVIAREFGKGRIYFHAWQMNDYGIGEFFRRILARHGIAPEIEIRKEKRDELSGNIEFHEFSDGKMTIWYLMNCDRFPKIVRMKSPRLNGTVAQEIFDGRRRLPQQGNEVLAFLPPARRVLLAVASVEELEQQFGKAVPAPREEYRKELEKFRSDEARHSKKPGIPIDLKPYCNQGFDNRQGYGNRIAWQEGKECGLNDMPFDHFYTGGYLMEPIRLDFNNNNTTIALKSRTNPEGMATVRNIPINLKVRSLTFFHAVTHAEPGTVSHIYRIHYADGSSIDLPNVVGEQVGSWLLEKNPPEIRKRIAWRNKEKKGFFLWNWENPHPGKTVAEFDILAPVRESDQTALIVGVTAQEYRQFRKLNLPAGWSVKTWTTRFPWRSRLQLTPESPSGEFTGKPLEVSREIVSQAFLCYEINQLPDAWGNYSKLCELPAIILRWEDGAGKKVQTSGVSRQTTWSWVNANYVIDEDKNTWQTIRIPLNQLIPNEVPGPVKIDKINIWRAEHNSPVLEIRNLRLEY